jgi:hypothetical protein
MPRAITATVGYGLVPIVASAMVCLDSWQGAAMGVQCVPLGGAAYTIDLSFDNPNDLIAPIPLASMAWDTTMIPAAAISSFNPTTFSLPTAPIWIRVTAVNGVGSIRATFLQLGRHSRSNIVFPSELLVTGPNFNAVHSNGGPTR